MRGDLSKLPLPAHENYTGVLYQQGRVRLDQDDNAEQFIAAELRRLLGQDVIGAGVAAVPADASGGFKVTQAAATAGAVNITLQPGRVWVDGLHLELPTSAAVTLPATYFGPPVQSPAASTSSIADGIRDAVILELWEEALSAYQDPTNLLEPALGGPDTTERLQLNFNLRLYRLDAGDDCRTIAGKLKNNFGGLGKLTVTPAAVVVLGGDCPVDTGGGYTGLEHYLYRVEIATPDATGDARFKYSRFNGGLVGRGSINLAGTEVNISANQQMINHCGLSDFYLEAMSQPGPNQPWSIAFTAKASLIADGALSLSNTTGAWPAPANVAVFFRLWDGIRRISDFTATTELADGIQLQFDAPSPASGVNNYRPGDFWTFPVRAAGSGFDPSVWPNNAPPQGIVYHRAPLAEIDWTSAVPNTVAAPDAIEDCRRPFPPLTRGRCCCTYSVGDGVTTFGDFNAIEEAVAALPSSGGEICILPGLHTANVRVERKQNVRIHGCGRHTIVIPRPDARSTYVFHIIDSIGIEITQLSVATFNGTGIAVESARPGVTREIELTHMLIVACLNGIVVANAAEVGIRWNKIRVIDLRGLECILLNAEGAWIERNDLGVVPSGTRPPGGNGDQPPPPDDPCADPEPYYGRILVLRAYLDFVSTFVLLLVPKNPFRALGGIRLTGGAKRVRVLENLINGGAGNGITLGGTVTIAGEAEDINDPGTGFEVGSGLPRIAGKATEAGAPLGGVTLSIRRMDGAGPESLATTATDGSFVFDDASIHNGGYNVRSLTPGHVVASAAATSGVPGQQPTELDVVLRPVETPVTFGGGFTIEEILVERNEIARMGLSGIGTAGLGREGLKAQLGIPVFDIEINGNLIHHCLQNVFTNALLAVARTQGLGGISLGICDEVTIDNNRIEHCGTSHLNPTCGIFVKLADHIEVRDNMIADNGPPVENREPVVQIGVRGGIVLGATALAVQTANGGLAAGPDQQAARISRNMVRQPMGLALAITAFGPVAVVGNYFSSELRGPSAPERVAGTVFILNLASREVAALRSGERAAYQTFNASPSIPIPDGKTLYNDNQVRLGLAGSSVTCQMIATGGDLGYDANQSDYLGPGFAVGTKVNMYVNTMLIGDSVRACDSRFKEGSVIPRSPVVSLFSYGVSMNITSQNQGDHCIFGFSAGLPAVNTPNQVLDSTFCPRLGEQGSTVFKGAVLGRF